MENFVRYWNKANRLELIAERVGFALWQIQELEGATAQYFVLVAQATKGMGLSSGMALFEKAQKKTFGVTVRRLIKEQLLDAELETRLAALLSERNWLVHRSRADSRSAVHHDSEMRRVVRRIDSMADESLSLLKKIGELIEEHAKGAGVSTEYIEEKAEELLSQWRSVGEHK